MTVTTSSRLIVYHGTGTVGPFTFAFPVYASTDLTCLRYDSNNVKSTLVINVDYSVALVRITDSDSYNGSITLMSALQTGYTLVIMRTMDYLQGQNWQNLRAFTASSINDGLDKIDMQVGQVAEQVNRAFQVPPWSTLGPLELNPSPSKLIGWDSSGTGLYNYPTTTITVPEIDHIGNHAGSLTQAVADIGASKQLLMINSAVDVTANVTVPSNIEVWIPEGGTIRTNGYTVTINTLSNSNGAYQIFDTSGGGTVILSHSTERIPQWWGAVADGVTDSTSALQAWATSISNNSTLVLGYLPPGKYLVTDTITITNAYSVTLRFDGQIKANMDKAILTLTHFQWANIEGLWLYNSAVTSNARCLSGTNVYSVNFHGGRVHGGYYCIDVQGNNLIYDGIEMGGAGGAAFRARSGGDNVSNTIRGCAIEFSASAAYGGLYFDSTTGAGYYYDWLIQGNYFEGNGTVAHINIYNGFKVTLENNYFGMQSTDGPAVLLSGTFSTCYVTAKNNYAIDNSGLGGLIFFKQASTSYMKGLRYSNNNVNSSSAFDIYGSCPGAINIDSLRQLSYIQNWNFAALTGWTKMSGSSDPTTTTTISPYGDGLAAVKETATYIYQVIKVRPNANYRLSAWMSKDSGVTTKSLQIYNSGLSTSLASSSSTTNSAEEMEVYWNSGSYTSVAILLRGTGGTGNFYSSGVKMTDMTN